MLRRRLLPPAGCSLMLKDFSLSAAFMGLLAAFVGFASTFAVVMQGLRGVGASEAEAATGLMAATLAMGLCSILLAFWKRIPAAVAWSTPGAALLASGAALENGFAEAVGAFLMCGALLTLAGLWRPFGRAVAAIPAPLANALLAGVLMGLCLAPVQAVAEAPALALPIVIAWALAGRLHRLLAVPAALAAFVAVLMLGIDIPPGALSAALADPTPDFALVAPMFSLAGLVGVALPLFVVTMASQNIPGAAVLKSAGYDVDPGPLYAVTGVFSLIFAPLGGHAVNLAAITAALCAGEDAHPDPRRRYWAAAFMGFASVVLGLAAGAAVAVVSLAPTILIKAVAGLALIGALTSSATAAFAAPDAREAAAVTFLTTASGVSFFGISGAFWGLLAGLALWGLSHLRLRRRA